MTRDELHRLVDLPEESLDAPITAVGFDESPEGHALRFDRHGRLVWVNIIRPRTKLERGELVMVSAPAPAPMSMDSEALSSIVTAASRGQSR